MKVGGFVSIGRNMALIILALTALAWGLTKILKWEHTFSYVVFLIALAILSPESQLFLVMWLIVVHFQTVVLKERWKSSGLDIKDFLKQREASRA